MTQEEKELLIKDLCARLPYSDVQINISYADGFKYDKTLTYEDVKNYSQLPACSTTIVKPYLRPMSSMTKEEKYQYEKTQWKYQADYCAPEYFDGLESYDWLNAHLFDYRGLIEKGLALEAPKGMYNNKTRKI